MEPSENGKMFAALSYGGFFFGFPLGVIPLIQRDDPFSLFHARHSTAVWLVSMGLMTVLSLVYTFITFVTCGFGAILFPILLLPLPWMMLVGIHGLVLSLNGEMEEPMGTFGLGDLLFSSVQLKEDPPATALPESAESAESADPDEMDVVQTDESA